MRRSTLFFLLFGTVLNLVVFSKSFSEKRVYYVKPAVVFVYCPIQAEVTFNKDDGTNVQMPGVNIGSMGSGFIINPNGYIVTNGHVVQEYYNKDNSSLKQQIIASIVMKDFIPSIEKQKGRPLTQEEKIQVFQKLLPKFNVVLKKDLYVFLSNGEYYPAEIKQYSPPMTGMPGKIDTGGLIKSQELETGKDVSILKIEKRNLPTIMLGDSDKVQLQDLVYIIGYPGAVVNSQFLSKKSMLEASITSGHVSSLKLDIKGTPVIQFDAAIAHGNSGGPVINSKGEVIGVATFGSLAQNGQSLVQGFNFGIPVNTVKEFIRAAGIVNKPGIFNKIWAQILDSYFMGPSHSRYHDVVAECDQLLRIIPRQPDVKKIQLSAQQWLLENPETFLSKYGAFLIILVIVLMVAGVIVVLFFMKTKAKPRSSSIPQAQELKKTVVDVGAATKTISSFGRIVCEKGHLAGKTFTVPRKGLKIGREEGLCDIVIPDDHISKLHAVIVPGANGVEVIDKNSTNGTYINEIAPQSITSHNLVNGDKIILGRKESAVFIYYTN